MDPRLAAALAAQRGAAATAAVEDGARERMAQALLGGAESAGAATQGAVGSMFSPQVNMERAQRFMTGIDPRTGEDLTERPLMPNAENGGRLGEIAAFLTSNIRKPGVAMRDMPTTMGGNAAPMPQATGPAGMDVNAAYEATKSEDPDVRRRAMLIYALRGGV